MIDSADSFLQTERGGLSRGETVGTLSDYFKLHGVFANAMKRQDDVFPSSVIEVLLTSRVRTQLIQLL